MVSVDDFAKQILDGLMEYDEEVDQALQKKIDKKSREIVKALKTHQNIPVKTGTYKKSFRAKTLAQGKGYKRNLVYAGGGEYRLAHLLEDGHKIFTGTSTETFAQHNGGRQDKNKKAKNKGKVQNHKKGGKTRAFPHWEDAQKMAEELYDEICEEIGT